MSKPFYFLKFVGNVTSMSLWTLSFFLSVKSKVIFNNYPLPPPSAIMMSLKLNESSLIVHVLESIGTRDIGLTVRSLPEVYLEKLLKFVAAILESSRHLEFYVTWAVEILQYLKTPAQTSLIHLQRNLNKKYNELAKM